MENGANPPAEYRGKKVYPGCFSQTVFFLSFAYSWQWKFGIVTRNIWYRFKYLNSNCKAILTQESQFVKDYGVYRVEEQSDESTSYALNQ